MQLSRSRAQRRVVRRALAKPCTLLRDRGSQQVMTACVQQRMSSNAGNSVHFGMWQHRQGAASGDVCQHAKHAEQA